MSRDKNRQQYGVAHTALVGIVENKENKHSFSPTSKAPLRASAQDFDLFELA